VLSVELMFVQETMEILSLLAVSHFLGPVSGWQRRNFGSGTTLGGSSLCIARILARFLLFFVQWTGMNVLLFSPPNVRLGPVERP
jgi:hypothetical protein